MGQSILVILNAAAIWLVSRSNTSLFKLIESARAVVDARNR